MANESNTKKRGCPKEQALINGRCFKKANIVTVNKPGICPDHKGESPKLFYIKDLKMQPRCAQCLMEFLERNQYEDNLHIFRRA